MANGEHNCVDVLQKLVHVQHDKICDLENELKRLATFFGQRELLLLRQVGNLHEDFKRQGVVLQELLRSKRTEAGSDQTVTESKSKVNGKDVSGASHEETIAAFTSAQEPIIVEVLKRSSSTRREMTSESLPSYLCDNSTQTEWTGAVLDSAMFSFNQTNLLHQPNNQTTLGNDISTHFTSLIGDQEVDEDDGCDVEYEEVTLHKSPDESRLGLTLCYGAPDEPDTDIYISEIDPDSVAAKDGRVQEGDQLLQINGVDVRSREQAVNLFSEKRLDYTLLLARPQISEEEYLVDHHQGYNILLEQEDEDATTDTGTTENAHLEKDSGVGRTDESTKNDESSEHDAADTCSVSCGDMNCHPTSNHGTYSGKDSDSCFDDAALQEGISRFRAQLASKGMALAPLCKFQSDSSLDREMALLNKEMENIQLECENLVHRHLESQQRGNDSYGGVQKCQLEHVYVNLSDFNGTRSLAVEPPGKSLPVSKKESVEKWVNSMVLPRNSSPQYGDSSSAYNTADSSGSVPLTLELTPLSSSRQGGEMYGSLMSLVSPKMEDKGTQLRESDVASMFSCDSCRRCCREIIEKEAILSRNESKKNPKEKEVRSQEEKSKNQVSFYPGPNTMYTNQANLEHTIWLQQQMLRQTLMEQQQKAGQRLIQNGSANHTVVAPPSGGNRAMNIGLRTQSQVMVHPKVMSIPKNYSNGYHMSSSPSKSGTLSTVREDEEMKMEWKVKRRADGTRYITRRPVRNRLLKARAMKIMEERTGITTDDDAASELKIGRYWTKEERKRHLERSRDRKKKEMVIRSRMMTSVKEQGEECEDGGKKEINILELSHKKMMRRRGKVIFDDFTTVQEVLAHGVKVPNPGGKNLGLLTVTTV